MSKSKRIVGPFQSEFGTFQPGDKAIAITTCTGRLSVTVVEYVGYIERQEYRWDTRKTELKKFAQVRRPTQRGEWYDKDTGETTRWSPGRNLGIRYVEATIITTLQYNRLIPANGTATDLMKAL